MGRDRDPYERTVDRLRRRLRDGAFGYGRPMQIKRLAADMAVSSTPIREALARLSGEGLIERSAAGYVTLRYDSASLADLYALDEVYALAPQSAAGFTLSVADNWPGEGYLSRTEQVLFDLGRGHSVVQWSVRRILWDRLAPFRQVEAVALEAVEDDLRELEAAGPVGKTLRAYYRRRIRAAPRILATALARNIK